MDIIKYKKYLRTGCSLLLLIIGFSVFSNESPVRTKKTNIVFILADDLGWKDVGYNGEGFYETPNIDMLAKDGIIFTNNYSAGPNCAPSRASLFSGMYTPRHHLYTPGGKSKGMLKNMRLKVPSRDGDTSYNTFQSNNDEIDPDIISIPEVLGQAGYISARFGKWHIGDDNQGFDISSSNGITSGLEEKHYGDINVADHLTEAALDFIEENNDKPFFLYISHWDVHTPIHAKEEVVRRYKEKLERTVGDWNPVYAAMIEAVDNCVGRVRNKLEELGIAENTLVVFTSDNGGHSHITHNRPLKGGKGSLFEGGIRVPACMAWLAQIKSGSTCDIPISGVDFMPTFAEIVGAPLPTSQPVDGVSILPLMKGKNKLDRESIFWFYPLYLSGNKNNKVLPVYGTDDMYWRAVPSCAVRKGDWKLIYYFEDNSAKLFNLKNDIGEKYDLATVNVKKAAELIAEIKAWLEETCAPVPTEKNPVFQNR